MSFDALGTLLKITPLSGRSGFALTPYAGRGATQTLDQIDSPAPATRRDINGTLYDVSAPQFEKYQSSISFKDTEAPKMDKAWRGQPVEVECAYELSYDTGGTAGRPVVAGSDRVDGHTTYYRPVLQMRVKNVKSAFNEWGAEYVSQMDLEEI